MSAPSPATENQVREELQRVLSSRQFADSPRLSRFLAYIVERTLAQETGQVKEYTIGLAVFDRPEDFDPRLDTIVRVQASKLRNRLNDYYGSEGSSNPVQIRLPRGSYIPTFECRASEPAAVGEASPARTPWAGRYRFRVAAAAGVALAFAAGFLTAVRIRPQPHRPDPVQFELFAPAGYVFLGSPQLSPDGKKLAVAVLRAREADTAIYVHSLETGTGGIQPGTINGFYPYWTPDGRSIVFTRAANLYRADLAGRDAVKVGAADGAFGMDWNQNGVILIAGNPGPVRRLSGGESAVVTSTGRPEAAHVFPDFLPGGTHFLYLARNETPGDSAIYIASLDGKWKKRLLPTETKAFFVPSPDSPLAKGWILFVHAGELLAQPFDLKHMELTGTPRRVAGGIQQYPYGAATFSATESVLAFNTAPGVGGQLTWFDRTGRILGELGPAADLGDPAISPDGARVAYDQADGSNRDVWTLEISSGKATRITFDPEVDHAPVWSPDGSRIAFESHRSPPGIYVTGSRGGTVESLLLPGGDGPSDWSPDGARLLFESMRTAPEPHSIWLVPATGEHKPRLWLGSAGNVQNPALAPNGEWIAYTSNESGRSDIYVKAFDRGSDPGRGRWQVSVGGGSQPVWRNDGKELFYLSPDNVLMVASVKTGAIFNYDRPVALFDTRVHLLRGPRNDYATRDGKRFLIRVPAHSAATSPIHVFMNWSAAIGN